MHASLQEMEPYQSWSTRLTRTLSAYSIVLMMVSTRSGRVLYTSSHILAHALTWHNIPRGAVVTLKYIDIKLSPIAPCFSYYQRFEKTLKHTRIQTE